MRTVCLLIALGWAVPVLAQTTEEKPSGFRDSLVASAKEPDQGGGIHFTEHMAVVFGGIKQGSGMAIGPALSHKFGDGSYAQLKAVYSIRHFRLLQARYDSRRFWRDRPT